MSGSGQIVTEGGLGEHASLRGGRRRYLDGPPQPEAAQHWPGAWRALLSRWLRRAAATRRTDSLLKGLDGPELAAAQALIDALLHSGWISLDEVHERGGVWRMRQMAWRDADLLRETLGLARLDAGEAARRALAERRFSQPDAHALHAALLALPEALWSRRIDLVEAVERWVMEGRRGSQRDFELLARGATKSLGSAEWDWLRQSLDLDALGIGAHTPGLWLRGGFRLELPRGRLDLGASPEPLALTPETIALAHAISAPPREWRVVENRTSFERQARATSSDVAVLWVPGRAPTWWRTAVAQLLRLAPAPAHIACDPDPAGIAIALDVAALWDTAGLEWHPLGMDAEVLSALPALQPLSDWDRQLLDTLALRPLPPSLASLRQALAERGTKGEQEGWL